ncbi:MAG: potassium transporter Kup [Phycisphaeraceae bacterium]|nr:MAG: potassium transporter Kup [Phycisphaeraceae bacterium]
MTNNQTGDKDSGQQNRQILRMTLLALGVVYGDIGTSPLYALRECFHGEHAVAVTPPHVYGVLSLIVWALIIIISVKYLVFVLRADNNGEGGILALMALMEPRRVTRAKPFRWALVLMGLFGAALLYGDGMITPAISVLSAVEGLKVATDAFDPYVIPITIAILIALFAIQNRGTAAIGSFFGPVITVWFITLAILGLGGLVHHPGVLRAFSPHYGLAFLFSGGAKAFLVLGSVFLVATGGEALYADMGHFGSRPIRLGWFSVVLPSLLLNYFGQGAYLLEHPDATANTFYSLAPHWALYPLVVLATLATVIASQAVISGVFSLTMQAIHLGYAPRLRIDHTSASQMGQIYLGLINWVLLAATIGLVLGFKNSSGLAAAYGVAVTITMVITTILFSALAWNRWKWPPALVVALMVTFLVIDLAFFGANIIKIEHGGWFPLLVAGFVFVHFTTWSRGRMILGERIREQLVPVDTFIEQIRQDPPTRVPGTAIFMTGNLRNVPPSMQHNLRHNHVLHEQVVLLSIVTEEVSHIRASQRIEFESLPMGFRLLVAHYGFMQQPNVPALLRQAAAAGLDIDPETTTFFLGRETLLSAKKPSMAAWRSKLFALMSRNAHAATAYFHIPTDRVIEVGMQIEL